MIIFLVYENISGNIPATRYLKPPHFYASPTLLRSKNTKILKHINVFRHRNCFPFVFVGISH